MSASETEVRPDGGAPAARRPFLRERGTRTIVILTVVVVIAWVAYAQVNAARLASVQWPPLKPDPTGLTVLGLLDRERPGWEPRYRAYNLNRAWQIRYRDEVAEPVDAPEEEDEFADRPQPAGASRVSRGAIVPLSELLAVCPVVLTGAHFTGARLEEGYEPLFGESFWKVHMDLTDEGRSRYWQFSRRHHGERLVFLLGDEIIVCPMINHMNVRTITIEQFWIKADAERLAAAVNRPQERNGSRAQ
ncbi:MAG TPA: hypothetical protein VLH79_08785 [Chthonomonadales bacterium]|nr:hypothetical protein [Chthonomonadales bacterium]